MKSTVRMSWFGACAMVAAMLALPVGTQAAEPTAAEEPKPASAEERIEDFLAKSKNPFEWFAWGADLRLRESYANNHGTLDKGAANNELAMQRYRTRWWMTLSPVKDVDVNLRLIWEGRHYTQPDNRQDYDQGDVLFDKLNLTLKNLGGSPLSVVAGRQEFTFGDGWLIFEGTPLDGSRTIFFDAYRFTYDLKDAKTAVDVIYLEQTHNGERWLTPMQNMHRNMMEQNERGLILYVTNKALPKTQVDGYFIFKRDLRQTIANTVQGEIYTFGGRLAQDLSDHWQYHVEGAHQFGHKNGRYLRAFGFNSEATYLVKDKLKNRLGVAYEFRSGDDPDSPGTDEAFDSLWNRYPIMSELLFYTWALETRAGDVTNLHRIAGIWQCDPTAKTTLIGKYHLLFADENTLRGAAGFSDSASFRGQLLALWIKHKFSEHLSAHVVNEFFFPGGYYTDLRNDVATFLRGELVFSW
ncbi:MAG TPA: alginate export family protein [Phycisphaerae bacterium]|nr:alginate export family protein [Phycisphaerae bacterium]